MITKERLAELRAMLSTEPSDMEWMIGGCDGSIRQTELLLLLDLAERLAEAEAERDRLQSQLAKAAAALRGCRAALRFTHPGDDDYWRAVDVADATLAELDASPAGGEDS